jgi:hypothetical protein
MAAMTDSGVVAKKETMGKHRILTVGFELPCDDFEYVNFESDQSLLDADIVLYRPTRGGYIGYDSYGGKPLLSEHASFRVDEKLKHWRSEIMSAVTAGKLVIVYLAKPDEFYRYTGRKEYSGTGRSRVTTNLVTPASTYDAIPILKSVVATSGTAIRPATSLGYLASYWAEFGPQSPYEAYIEGAFTEVLLQTKSGGRVVGAAVRNGIGTLLFLPPIELNEETFIVSNDTEGESDDGGDAHSEGKPGDEEESYWSDEAIQFGKRLAKVLAGMASSLSSSSGMTPPPSWAGESKYRLKQEGEVEAAITEVVEQMAQLQARRTQLERELEDAGTLRRLLYETGRPLEVSILEALHLLGFEAEPYSDGDSEFDAVFTGPEGRFLGEAEGKDNRAINIDKLSQLERNIQEDFARDEVSEYAKGVLFGNGFRLMPPEERRDEFTQKCLTGAKRAGIALVRTRDLFDPARYLKSNSDAEYAALCRRAIFEASGEVVRIPAPPEGEVNTVVATEASVRDSESTPDVMP